MDAGVRQETVQQLVDPSLVWHHSCDVQSDTVSPRRPSVGHALGHHLRSIEPSTPSEKTQSWRVSAVSCPPKLGFISALKVA